MAKKKKRLQDPLFIRRYIFDYIHSFLSEVVLICFSFQHSNKMSHSNNGSSERTPLLVPVNTVTMPSGSVVSYTVSQQNCSNNTLKDRTAANSTKRKLWFAVGLACCFFATELVAGYFANSLGKYSPRRPVYLSFIDYDLPS